MSIWDLLFGRKGDCSVQEAEIQQLKEAMQSTLNELKDQIKANTDLSARIYELESKIDELTAEVQTLDTQVKEETAKLPEAEQELAAITERVQSVLNMSLHGVDFIWRNKGYVVQIHPDTKFDETKDYPVLRDRIFSEMKNSKFCEVQEINFRTFFIKVK